MSRPAEVRRDTRETQIVVRVDLDGGGATTVATPLPFFGHMLEALGRHAVFDLQVEAAGDVAVDPHHLVEDVGLVLGQALLRALGDRHGIRRMGDALVPMDDALAQAAVDLSGRPAFVWQVAGLDGRTVGTFDAGLMRDFFQALASEGRMNLHLRLLHGEDPHHAVEALCKATARALHEAVTIDPRVAGVPSTKGAL
ncbi:MAG: imidazoleglycerol-phosphate dehydratase HisB [Deltaproteobacteria bacterium]|nr:imidazoleglycerol-phosphate dehydratase HisB [Deltaproteobacteria bacterium]